MKLTTKSILVPIFLYSIAIIGQRPASVQEFLETKLSKFHKMETVNACLELILSQNLDSVISKVPIGLPLQPQQKGFTITGVYGLRNHPIEKKVKIHKGLDIAAKVGTPVISTGYGKIIKVAKSHTGYGNMVIIEHAYGFKSLYAHLSEILVTKGQLVTPGQTIALIGSTGKATGSHLHYEIHKNGIAINPKNNILLKIKMLKEKEVKLTVSESSEKPILNLHGGYNP